MKIGYLVQTLNRKTGGGRFAADIIDGVKQEGHEVVILKEDDDGGEGHAVLGRGLKMFTSAYASLKYLKGCDVIHAIDGYPYGVTAWLANLVIGARLMISALGTYAVAPLYRWPTSILLKAAYRNAYKVVAISNYTKNEILKKVLLTNITVVTPGITPRPTPERHDSKSDKKFIISVGGRKERKGYHISLEAFAQISNEFPDLNYVIIGDEDLAYQTWLDAIIEKYNIHDRVIFKQKITDEELFKLYSEAELFILTPISTTEHHFEGFGLVYLEAAQYGLPVIGTKQTGAEDAISEGFNGYLVPQRSIENTTSSLRTILNSRKINKSMKIASINWAEQHSIKKEVEELCEMYN